MKPLRSSILLMICGSLLLMAGCSSYSAVSKRPQNSGDRYALLTEKDPATLSDREKWSLARRAFAWAEEARDRGDSEVAARFYGATLELLGGLDLASIDLETQRVLTFNRKVLESYDEFVESIKVLPPGTGLTAVLEAEALESPDETEIEIEPWNRGAEVDSTPVIDATKIPLPQVPSHVNSRVRNHISFFKGKGRSVMQRWMERSAEVFPRLRPILREEGIPEEVLYLAMIESGLNLKAYSYARASGLWQFIPSTARIYGLNVDRVYDERRHVELATRAACSYLRKLYDQFGDWYLAFAAYNCGEGRVEREIRRRGTRNFWKMRRLPRQTRNYVPTYLAAREICENPTQYGFPPMPPEKPFECRREWVHGPYKLEDIADAAGVDPAVTKELNPEFMQGIVPRAQEPFMVRMPREPRDDFKLRLADKPETDIQPTTAHRVRRGETLGSIARRYGTTVRAIRALPENRRIKPRKMRIGQEVIVPVPSVRYAGNQSRVTQPASYEPTKDGDQIIYTVHRGETLGRIGRQLGVSVDQICRENGIANQNRVYPGQKLRITVQGKPQYASKQTGKLKYHTVRRGDTVWAIARAYHTTTKSILDWNHLSHRSKIYPGQKLIVSR